MQRKEKMGIQKEKQEETVEEEAKFGKEGRKEKKKRGEITVETDPMQTEPRGSHSLLYDLDTHSTRL